MAEDDATHRFTPKSDIILLRELAAMDIVKKEIDWDKIVKNTNAAMAAARLEGKVNERQTKDRKNKLVKAFRSDTLASLKASGTIEEYEEREQLLEDIVQKLDELGRAKNKKVKADKVKNAKKEAQGLRVRDEAMKTLGEPNMPKLRAEEKDDDEDDENFSDGQEDAEEPRRKKPRVEKKQMQSELIEILKERNQIQKKEINLMTKKFEAETEERKQMIQLIATMMPGRAPQQ